MMNLGVCHDASLILINSITTGVDEIPEIITSDEYGLLCEPKDSPKPVESILEALERNYFLYIIE